MHFYVKHDAETRLAQADVIRLYLKTIQMAGLSQSSRAFHARTLNRISERIDILKPEPRLYRYFSGRVEAVAPTTINAEISVLRKFYDFCRDLEILPANFPVRLPRYRKIGRRLPKTVPPEDVARLLAAPDISKPLGLRDHLIIRCIYETGITARELINLSIDDLHEGALVIYQPVGWRLAPISDVLGKLLLEYHQTQRDWLGSRKKTLFMTRKKTAFRSPRAVWSIFERYQRQINLTGAQIFRATGKTINHVPLQKIYPQVLRATFASELMNRGHDLLVVKKLLGVRSMASVERLIPLDLRTLRAEHKKRFR